MTVITDAPRIEEFDEGAWQEVFRRYEGLLRSLARSFRLTPQEAEDAAQTTWLLLVQHAESVRDPARVGGWLRSTMRHTCLRIVRQRGRERLAGGFADWPLVDSGPTPDDDLLREERNATLWAAVDTLPPRQRELVRALFASCEPSYEDVSARLSMPIGGIGPTRSRALGRLRDVLDHVGLDLDDLG
ncbi:MAG TPA: sigma-70 family RNA polymerase sigma factor [Kineosporiaceae bacterium]|nr:sigma-70 family RNA polymerase sigma factor [Kineosporiaceae bacterium]